MKIDSIKFTMLQGEMTVVEFAQKVGISPVTVYNISNTGRCSRITLFKILRAFQIKPEDLLAKEDDND